jgi:DNA helicase-2/ATP-dependent DNA helicase PcrA
MRWDENLEGPAKRIAAIDHSPLRVLAGPGTGKTYAMMRRVARLLEEGADPRPARIAVRAG